MFDSRLTFAVLASILVLGACSTNPADPDQDLEYLGPAVVDLSPSPGQEDFFFEDNLWARFEWAPDNAELTLLDDQGAEVAAQKTISSDGVLYTLDPVASLDPSSDYTLEIRVVEPEGGAIQIAFSTSPHGQEVNPEAGGLWGAVFRVETVGAELIEPASAGPVILSQVDSWNLLMGFAEESSFAEDEQPGVHMRMARGEPTNDGWEPDPCSRTADVTYGPDGVLGSSDDAPAYFDDPYIEMGPEDLNFMLGLIPASVQQLFIRGIFHPELSDMKDFTVDGVLDTRALDLLFDAEVVEGVTCNLLDALDILCEECGGANPGPFCLPIRAEKVSAVRVAVPPLERRNCADIVAYYDATGECAEQVAQWEPAADGTYALCPEYSPPAP